MAIVYLPHALNAYTGGRSEIAIDAPRVLELRAALERRFPGIQAELEQMAVAIDGQIHHDADYERVEQRTEVHFVPRVAGGA
jgi:molybdopterin converting factor small subunit